MWFDSVYMWGSTRSAHDLTVIQCKDSEKEERGIFLFTCVCAQVCHFHTTVRDMFVQRYSLLSAARFLPRTDGSRVLREERKLQV